MEIHREERRAPHCRSTPAEHGVRKSCPLIPPMRNKPSNRSSKFRWSQTLCVNGYSSGRGAATSPGSTRSQPRASRQNHGYTCMPKKKSSVRPAAASPWFHSCRCATSICCTGCGRNSAAQEGQTSKLDAHKASASMAARRAKPQT